MFGEFFSELFVHQGFQAPQDGNPPRSENVQPPASTRAINSLPMVKVTADDLLEETNKECIFCLEEQKLGSLACKLACGHLFHRDCVVEWLKRKCTCPVCRYEIETDDPHYEAQRKKRMKTRKLRMRKDELQSKSISQLRALSSQLNVNISHCIDKREIVDTLIGSGHIDITERVPPIELTEEEFNGKSVSQLKHLLLSFGLSEEGALEKNELRRVLLESGRILLVSAIEGQDEVGTVISSSNRIGADKSCVHMDSSESTHHTSNGTSSPVSPPKSPLPTPTNTTATSGPAPRALYRFSIAELQQMSLSRLRTICGEVGVSVVGCLDKFEVIDRLRLCSKIGIISEDTTS